MFRNMPIVTSFTSMWRDRRRRGWLCATFSVLLAAAWLSAADGASSAVSAVVVSLNFDDNLANQYTLGFQNALRPAGVGATFYINSGTVGTTYPGANSTRCGHKATTSARTPLTIPSSRRRQSRG